MISFDPHSPPGQHPHHRWRNWGWQEWKILEILRCNCRLRSQPQASQLGHPEGCCYKPRDAEDCQEPAIAREGQERFFSSIFRENMALWIRWYQCWEKIHFCHLKSPHLWSFILTAPGNEHTSSLLPLWPKNHILQKNHMWLKIIDDWCTQGE